MGKRLPIRAAAAVIALEIILDASLRIDFGFSDMNLSIREDIDEVDGLLLDGNCPTEYGQWMIGVHMSNLIGSATNARLLSDWLRVNG
jgi:hypothetical protein